MSNKIIDVDQGHWLLSKMGKKVLRPGGKELTIKLIEALNITSEDNVIEFAPGIGFTALYVLKKQPASYTGIELNEEAAQNLRRKINGVGRKIILGNASNISLENASADKIYGEAMLTMHADHRKSEIIKEAHRLLKKGGLYGVHELSLTPDTLDEKTKAEIQRGLAQNIKVNARPLTQSEWIHLIEKEGFRVKKIITNPMRLLEAGRIINDEGFFHSLKIGFNIITHPRARKRIRAMRCIFKKNSNHINAVAIIAEKI